MPENISASFSVENKIFVIKYGGHAMDDPDLNMEFAKNIQELLRLGAKIIIVHGGGPHINSLLGKLNIQAEFKNGLRVTSKEVLEVVEMVLCGAVNKEVVALFEKNKVKAFGFSGKDGCCLRACKIDSDIDYGLVGEIEEVDAKPFNLLLDAGYVPVFAPLGVGINGQSLNINADTAAGAIAGAVGADSFILVTDVSGVLNEDKELIASLSQKDIDKLIADEVIFGGMIPKVVACLNALKFGVRRTLIVDGREKNSLLNTLLGRGNSGTVILP